LAFAWVLLREMLDTGAANPSLLAGKVGMTRGAISKLIERLCRKKLAVRLSSDGDRRFQIVALSAKGMRLVPVFAEAADENDREFFGHLKPEEKDELVALLQEIVRRQGWQDSPLE
jgi:DNA-binding MarR family transcriptional regulator